MPNLHYHVNVVDYIDISNKFVNIINLFMELLKDSKSIFRNLLGDVNPIISIQVSDIENRLSSNRKLVCTDKGYTRHITGQTQYLTMNLARTSVSLDVSTIDKSDLEQLAIAFSNNYVKALKDNDLYDINKIKIARISANEMLYIVKFGDHISIDVTIRVPYEVYDEEDENDKLFIEFNLNIGNDSVID